MLANPNETTPTRPRPPAKARRASQQPRHTLDDHHHHHPDTHSLSLDANVDPNVTPPPAYNSTLISHHPDAGMGGGGGGRKPRLDTLLGSPMMATFTKMGWETMGVGLPPSLQQSASQGGVSAPMGMGERQPSQQQLLVPQTPSGNTTEWVNEKSREELTQLVGKAGEIIREREQDLGLTAAVRKSLYDNNVALKHKHQALLGRLPQSPIASPAISTTPLLRSSSGSLSRSTSDSILSAAPSPHPSYRAHGRKISVTPHDISLLADQNAELLDKLEQLESESQNSDQTGRRVLKRLEKEIAILRDELDKTQARSEELEEQARKGRDAEKVAEEAWKKKKEREARVRAMRYNGQEPQEDEDEMTEIRDFAPGSSLFGSSVQIARPDARGGMDSSPSVDWSASLADLPENALISQLLAKIHELEDTNLRIQEQQLETKNQLQAVQRDTEQISKVYEALTDQPDIELELVEQHSTPENPRRELNFSSEETVRFHSFRRPAPVQRPSSSFEPDHLRNALAAHRARKSVVGLFDDSRERETIRFAQPQPLNLPIPFGPGHKHSWSVSTSGLASPALSSLDLATPPPNRFQDMSPIDTSRPTLESELAGEYGSWGLGNRPHHLRSNSLYDIAQQYSAPSSPSLFAPARMSPTVSQFANRSMLEPEFRSSPRTLQTPESAMHSALRMSVSPPTPMRGQAMESTPTGRQTARYQKITETLRSRTSRWVDGRFVDRHMDPDTLAPSPPSEMEDEDRPDGDEEDGRDRPVTPLPIRLASAIDSVMESFHGRLASSAGGSKETTPLAKDGKRELAAGGSPASAGKVMAVTTTGNSSAPGAPVTPKPGQKRAGVVGFVLELWLWMQFCLIILVFLWAMAKRGPKSVLGEAGQRQRRTSTLRR
ncbi:hypothetical protein BDN72DRAFT_849133 [Pluteus cervinus]|uniref:Uncharacterized protein n=1 Tax=Pluteus cervinus TaxID=181527 RepID=A0ACD3A8U6_9AGAR|nr:hypothetical protein BDN72DRAFT_849133 [Pluteus cervinus]